MSDDTQPAAEAIADLYTGTARALEAICRQLIDSKAINSEILMADLLQAQTDLAQQKVGQWGAVPAALYAALGGLPPK